MTGMEYKRLGHSVYRCQYHLVISTKYRRKVLTHGLAEYLKLTLKAVTRHYPDIVILEANTDLDHMHLLVSVPPKTAVSQAVSLIKANTARSMRTKFPFLDKVYYGTDSLWSIGYFVSTVGIDAETIRKYILHQGLEDSGQATLEF